MMEKFLLDPVYSEDSDRSTNLNDPSRHIPPVEIHGTNTSLCLTGSGEVSKNDYNDDSALCNTVMIKSGVRNLKGSSDYDCVTAEVSLSAIPMDVLDGSKKDTNAIYSQTHMTVPKTLESSDQVKDLSVETDKTPICDDVPRPLQDITFELSQPVKQTSLQSPRNVDEGVIEESMNGMTTPSNSCLSDTQQKFVQFGKDRQKQLNSFQFKQSIVSTKEDEVASIRVTEIDMVEDSETEDDHEDSLTIFDDKDEFHNENRSVLKSKESLCNAQTPDSSIISNEQQAGMTEVNSVPTTTAKAATFSIDPSILRAEMMKMLPDLLKELHGSCKISNNIPIDSETNQEATVQHTKKADNQNPQVERTIGTEKSDTSTDHKSPLKPELMQEEQSKDIRPDNAVVPKKLISHLSVLKGKHPYNKQNQLKSKNTRSDLRRSQKRFQEPYQHKVGVGHSKGPSQQSTYLRSFPSDTDTINKTIQQAIADQSIQKAMADQSIQKTMADQSIQKAIADQSIQKAMADQSIQKPMADQSIQKAMADQSIKKAIADQSIQKTMADQSIQKTMAAVEFTVCTITSNPIQSSGACIYSTASNQLPQTSSALNPRTDPYKTTNANFLPGRPCSVQFIGNVTPYKKTPQCLVGPIHPLQQYTQVKNIIPLGSPSFQQSTTGQNIFPVTTHQSNQTFSNSQLKSVLAVYPLSPPVSNIARRNVCPPSVSKYRPIQPAVPNTFSYSSDRDQFIPQDGNADQSLQTSVNNSKKHLKDIEPKLRKHMKYNGYAIASQIVDSKVSCGKMYFKVEWIGFSWEKESSLKQSELNDLLASFLCDKSTSDAVTSQQKSTSDAVTSQQKKRVLPKKKKSGRSRKTEKITFKRSFKKNQSTTTKSKRKKVSLNKTKDHDVPVESVSWKVSSHPGKTETLASPPFVQKETLASPPVVESHGQIVPDQFNARLRTKSKCSNEITSSNFNELSPDNTDSGTTFKTNLPLPKVSFTDSLDTTKQSETSILKDPTEYPRVTAILSVFESSESKDIGYREFDFASCLENKKAKQSPAGEKCSNCNSEFTSSELIQHNRIYENYSCPQCQVRMCSKRKLKKHILRHNRNIYQCPTCLRSFDDEKHFKLHKKTNHVLLKLESAEKVKQHGWKCNVCHKRFQRAISWRLHHKKHKRRTNFDLRQCPVCKKQFKFQKNLESHLSIHRLSCKECTQCLECFDFDENVQTHECSGQPIIRNVSIYEDRVRATKPSTKFSSTIRRRYIPFKRQKHPCLQCIQGFKSRDNFYEHINIHGCPNLEEKGECILCKRVLDSSDQLKVHVTNCFKESLNKLFRPKSRSDEESGDQLSVKNNIVYHCVKCNKLFPSSELLLQHKRIMHHRRENLKCNKCGFSCLSRALLKKHLMKKNCNSNSSYRCFLCDQNRISYAAFPSLSSLIKHFQFHNSNMKTSIRAANQSTDAVSSSVDKVIIKPALITNRLGKTMFLSISMRDVNKLYGQPGVCQVPDFGKYKVQVRGTSPEEYLTATSYDTEDVNSDSATDSAPSDIRINKRKLLRCFECDVQYPTGRLMVKHFKSFHRCRFIHLVVCNDCNIAFREKKTYDFHHNAVHLNNNSNKERLPVDQSDISNNNYVPCSQVEATRMTGSAGFHDDRCTNDTTHDSVDIQFERRLECDVTTNPSKSHDSYHCQTCDVSFNSRTSYQLHNTMAPNVTVCTLCDTPFFSRSLYLDHYTKHHAETIEDKTKINFTKHMNIVDITWPCYICQQKISHSDLSSHIKSHVVFECYHCNVKVSSRKLVLRHLNNVHGVKRSNKAWLNRITDGWQILYNIYKNISSQDASSQLSNMQCNRCNAVFFYKETLDLHTKLLACPSNDDVRKLPCPSNDDVRKLSCSSNDDVRKLPCSSNDDVKRASLESDKHYCWFPYEQNDMIEKARYILTCKLCFAIFGEEDEIREHMFSTHFDKQSSKKLFRKSNFSDIIFKKRFKVGSSLVSYRCHICGLKFSDELSSIKHAFLHLDTKLHECHMCNKSFVLMEELRYHYYTLHRCLFCVVCYKTFHRLADLKHHSQLHVLEVNIPRDENEKMVIEIETNANWQQTKQKLFPNDVPYQPQFAVTSKISPDILNDVRLFFCRVCKKNIEGELTYIVHMKTHPQPRPFLCLVCHKDFIRQEAYEVHFSKHFDKTGLLRQVCDACPDERENENIDSFHCEICHQVFETKEVLDEHVAKENLDGREQNFKSACNITDIIWRYCCGEKIDLSNSLEWKIADKYNLKELFLMLQRSLRKENICHAKCVQTVTSFHVCLFCHTKIQDRENHLQRHISITKPDYVKCVYCLDFECEAGKLFNHVKQEHEDKMDTSITACPYCYAVGDDVTPNHFELHQQNLPPSFSIMHCAYCNLRVPSTFLHLHSLTMWEIEQNASNENETDLSFARSKLKMLSKFYKSKQTKTPVVPIPSNLHHASSADNNITSSESPSDKNEKRRVSRLNDRPLLDFTVTSTTTSHDKISTIIPEETTTSHDKITTIIPEERKLYVSSIANMLMGGLENPVCCICHWKYNTFGDLKEHLVEHLFHPVVSIKYNSRYAFCVFCKAITRKTSMKTHLKLKHPKESEEHEKLMEGVPCRDKRTKTKSEKKIIELEIIDRDQNSNFRPYPFTCDCCRKGYCSDGTLLNHIQNLHPWLYEEERKKRLKHQAMKRNLKQISLTQLKKSKLENTTSVKGKTNSPASKSNTSMAGRGRRNKSNAKENIDGEQTSASTQTIRKSSFSVVKKKAVVKDGLEMQARQFRTSKNTRKIVGPGKPPISFKEVHLMKSSGENVSKSKNQNVKRNVLPVNNLRQFTNKLRSKSEWFSEPIDGFHGNINDMKKDKPQKTTPIVEQMAKQSDSDDEMMEENGLISETEEEIIESSSENEDSVMKKNTFNSEYSCPNCNLNFPCQTELQSHLTVHQVQFQQERYFSIPYPYICVYCGVGYYKTYALRQHLQGKHELLYKPDLEKDETFINRSLGVVQDYQKNNTKNCGEEYLPKRDRRSFENVLARVTKARKREGKSGMQLKNTTSRFDAVRSSARKRTVSEDVRNFLQKKKTSKKGIQRKILFTKKKKSSNRKTKTNAFQNRGDEEKTRELTSSESKGEVEEPGNESNEIQTHDNDSADMETDLSTKEYSDAEEPPAKEKSACEYCDMLLANQKSLKRHIEVHTKYLSSTEVFQMLCTYCKKVMPRHELKRHMHTTHTRAPLLKERNYCLRCDYTTKKDLEKHLLSDHPELLTVECRLCDLRFSTQNRYHKHFQNTHGKTIDEDSLECFTCNKKFQSISGLHYHYSIVHMQKDENFYCQLCSKFFYDQTHLDKHEKEYHKNDKFQCGLCLVEFTDVEKCEAHIQGHKKKTEFLCDVCGFNFNNQQILEKHKTSHGNQQFACDICNEILHGMDNFRQHKNVLHGRSPSRNMHCKNCSFRAENVEELLKHERCHSLQSNYECSVCEKTFTNLDNIQKHMTDVHHGGAPAIFKRSEEEINDNESASLSINECRICGETFLRHEIYVQHLKKHE